MMKIKRQWISILRYRCVVVWFAPRLREADVPQGTGLTYERAKKEIQASDDELEHALKDRRILIIDG
jgi:hypothetical protein